jgi:hypothetical protein
MKCFTIFFSGQPRLQVKRKTVAFRSGLPSKDLIKIHLVQKWFAQWEMK